MSTPDNDKNRRWTRWLVAAAIVPAAVVAIALAVAGAPGYQFMVLVPVAAISVGVVGALRGRITRLTTDERARELDLRARSVAFAVIGLALIGFWAGTLVSQGTGAAQPYFHLMLILYFSYLATFTWLRRRS